MVLRIFQDSETVPKRFNHHYFSSGSYVVLSCFCVLLLIDKQWAWHETRTFNAESFTDRLFITYAEQVKKSIFFLF